MIQIKKFQSLFRVFPRTIPHNSAFTLLELLIVIGILAILTTVVVLTINPAEYLKQARDTKRVVDLSNINKAVQLFDFDNTGIISTTSSTIVYVSIPDTSSICGNLGLPTLPSGYTYHCVTSDYLNKINGTGWIPLDLTKISGGSPLSSLPIDPINTTSTRNYYTYVQGGSFELAASFESASYKQGGEKDKTSTDKGAYTDLYEVGTNTALLPIDYGDSSLVGYWPMDNNVKDYSGNNNNGTSINNVQYLNNGKINQALSPNGLNTFMRVIDTNSLKYIGGNMTIEAWMFPNSTENDSGFVVSKPFNGAGQYNYWFKYLGGTQELNFRIAGFTVWDIASISVSKNSWHHIAVTIDSSKNVNLFVDGVNRFSGQHTVTNWVPSSGDLNYSMAIGTLYPYSDGWAGATSHVFDGLIDNARIYNRTLSALEISAIYNATK